MKSKHPSPLHQTDKHSRGQVFIIIAAAFLALVAFVGLAVDVGLAFVAYGKLSRSVDAAALAAAAQFREGRSPDEMQATAENSLRINGVDFTNIQIDICDWNLPPEDLDPQLCTQPYHKKLVRITVWADLPLAFLRVLGFDSVNLSASAISEAASMDVVLVLDISESMAWDAATGDPLRDPAQCNDTSVWDGSEDIGDYPDFPAGFPGECHPFEEVKNAASEFVLRVLDKPVGEEEDRLAVVTFGNGWSLDQGMGTYTLTGSEEHPWTNNVTDTLAIIRDLSIFQPEPCLWNYEPYPIRQGLGPCLRYDPPDSMNFLEMNCISCMAPDPDDFSYKTSTNIGGGLRQAGNAFSYDTREDSLWVVILLTDGMANATNPDESGDDDITDITTYPVGHCPNDWTFPLCQDEDVDSRHDSDDLANYDADDYARDMADYVGCYPDGQQAAACGDQEGQGAVVFTIGLGDGVTDNANEINGLPYGTSLLRYIADVGDDGDSESEPDFCEDLWEDQGDWETWCGNYYFSPEGSDLVAVFQDIASRVFTRLAR